MRIWTESMPTAKALEILGRTDKEIPFTAEWCAMAIYEPTGFEDRMFLDCLREAFGKIMFTGKNKFFCLVEHKDCQLLKVVTLVADENHQTASLKPGIPSQAGH